jgi:hypothetical protein
MAHWIGGTGCCWIEKDRDSLISRTTAETKRYAFWRKAWQPEFALPTGEARVLEEIQTAGGPVGISGSPMALFECDRVQVLEDDVIEAFDVA